ncbi:hypothetical protein [Bdellovibrio sp. HCB209]|uniref:hypothetical protein n=1 Tax=Bdellovibrio sp. HCB209 TaxID=3394354 RepID=UPI0039B64093
MKNLFAFLIVLLSLFSQQVFAQEHTILREVPAASRAWREQVTESDFRELLALKSKELPEMSQLWEHLEKNPEARGQVFLAGGILRGLMNWLDLELQKHPLSEVRKIPPPRIHSLIIEGADKDIFILGDLKKETLPHTYSYWWDVLEREILQEVVKTGGAKLDKMGVNPYGVSDPVNALQDFLKGRIEFVNVNEALFAKFRGESEKIVHNTKMALVLRHLRFLIAMEGVEIKASDLKSLSVVLKDEEALLKDRVGSRHFIEKALQKLIAQSRTSNVNYLSVLRDAGALGILNRNGFLPPGKTFPISTIRQAFDQKRSDRMDLLDIYMRSSEADGRVALELMDQAAREAATVQEFFRALDLRVKFPPQWFVDQVADLWIKNAAHFILLRPNADDWRKVESALSDSEAGKTQGRRVLSEMSKQWHTTSAVRCEAVFL